MYSNKELFDYWYDRVQLENYELIAALEHVSTQVLRHECTNYDHLWQSPEVKALGEPERSRIIAIIKYECTARVLQCRAVKLRDQATKHTDAYNELNRDRSRLRQIIRTLQEKIFGKDNEIFRLEARISGLEVENEALRAEAENNKAYAELLTEFEQLKKQYEAVEARRKELAKNNQRLGGKVAHTERYKKKRDEAMEAVRELRAQIQFLTQENRELQAENSRLSSELMKLQKLNKLGIVEIKDK